MNAGSWKSRQWMGLWVMASSLVWIVGWPAMQAYADSLGETIRDTFQIHGYVENQEIILNENFVSDYHVASVRNRLDLQPAGALIEGFNLPLMQELSIHYFMDIRPGYEGAYDIVPDRFGDSNTGFSGIGYSPFTRPISTGPGVALLKAFGYNPIHFKGVVARNFAFLLPIPPDEPFIDAINGVPTHCFHCVNVNVPQSNLRWERDDSNLDYYPLREAYLDFRWNFLGPNLLRLGKQQIVWGKADFFRLQDIVNPVDFAQHFFIEPFEDTRIPQLSAWFQHRFGDILGLEDVAGNFIWNFDQFIPVGLGQGGQPWAVNFGDQIRAFAFGNGLFDAGLCGGSATPGACNPNHVNFALTRERLPDWRLRNSAIGTKWDFQLPHPAIRFALTDYWGIRDTPTFVLPEINAAPLLNPACPSMATISGLPGAFGPAAGKLPFIATSAGRIHLAPNVDPQTWLNKCAFGANAEIRFHRANTLGLSADYFDQLTGVVIRVESSWTHNALLNDTDSLDWTTRGDILQYVVGFDRPHYIKFLNPDRTFFTSFQVYETYYPGAHSENGGKDGIVTGANDFTFTAFTQTHYYRDQIIPLVFAAFGTEGTDATIGGNTEWLITDHWSATLGADAFLGKSHQHNVGPYAAFQGGNPYSESIFGPAHMQAGGAERNHMDEFWTRLRYRF